MAENKVVSVVVAQQAYLAFTCASKIVRFKSCTGLQIKDDDAFDFMPEKF